MVEYFYCLTNLLFSDIPFCYINASSSIICCLFSDVAYFSFDGTSSACIGIIDLIKVFGDVVIVILSAT